MAVFAVLHVVVSVIMGMAFVIFRLTLVDSFVILEIAFVIFRISFVGSWISLTMVVFECICEDGVLVDSLVIVGKTFADEVVILEFAFVISSWLVPLLRGVAAVFARGVFVFLIIRLSFVYMFVIVENAFVIFGISFVGSWILHSIVVFECSCEDGVLVDSLVIVGKSFVDEFVAVFVDAFLIIEVDALVTIEVVPDSSQTLS